MQIKENVKVKMNKLVSKISCPVVVASCGRSGSTMLTRALADSTLREWVQVLGRPVSDRIANKIIIEYAWNLEERYLRSGFIYKTHDYPPETLSDHVKYIYVYSDPIEVISSVLNKAEREGEEWLAKHARHLNGKSTSRKDIIFEDSINIVENISRWCNKEGNNVLAVKYNNLWERQDQLSDFIGFDFGLPERKERRSSDKILNEEERRRLLRMGRRLRGG